MTNHLRVGTSGWSYPSGAGAWSGIFYPTRPCGAGRVRFDELAFYAEHFDTVEVNSTFYRPPRPTTVQSWVARTPPGFEFSLKLYQKFTHPEMFKEATGGGGSDVGQDDVDDCRRWLDPIAESDKLGAVLAQFPPSFKSTDASRQHLGSLLRAFRVYPIAVELRHRSWSDQREATSALLHEARAAWVQIDEPKFDSSIRQDYEPNEETLYYMRLHGRNANRWWSHETSDQRYDYLYSPVELHTIAATIERHRRTVRRLYVYFNNHFAAKAVANAVTLSDALGLPVRGEYPTRFAHRYPEVAGLVSTTSSLL